MNQQLLLIGGGHSHAIALRQWGINPLPGVEISLMSDVEWTPYSGMLPGYVAGLYDFKDTHIHLPQLAGFAQANFYLERAIDLDLVHNRALGTKGSELVFDYVSIDIGSTPDLASVPGAADYAIAAKPVPQFLEHWQAWCDQIKVNPDRPLTLAIVGGGVGGVELAFNMQIRLQNLLRQARQPPSNLTLHLFHRGLHLIPQRGDRLGRYITKLLDDRGIKVHLGSPVVNIEPQEGGSYRVVTSEQAIAADFVVWVTQATAPNWIRETGLAVDSRGFIAVNAYLQSLSHPQVFATGDIASLSPIDCPKAGVFAVRQGKPLAENLRRILSGRSLKPYLPQSRYLSLIGTGDEKAIALWGGLSCYAPWLWRWKDSIDRQFMRQFHEL